VSSVAFHNGYTADLDAIGELCARRDILFCVDAIQSVGVLPMDVRRSKISFLAADGHKWMCGSEGCALFYVAAEHRDKLDVLENGWTNIDRRGKFILSPTDLLPDARRFEAGSLNTNGVYGLRAAIDLLLEIGIDVVAERALAVASRLAAGLESIGWGVARRPIASPIVGATPPGVERTLLQWHRHLEENGRLSFRMLRRQFALDDTALEGHRGAGRRSTRRQARGEHMEAPRGVKRRLAAILSADAKGYSRLSTCRCFSFSADTSTTWMPRSLHDTSMRCKRRSNA
jgi:glutamate/tyrosine decarboxylase-like PLP-dependent enzyme